MGRIADRFAQKRDPRHMLARSLLKLAVAYCRELDDSALEALEARLQQLLIERSPQEFDELLSLVQDEAEPRSDGDEVCETLREVLESLCETVEMEDGWGYLTVVGVTVTSDELASGIRLSGEAQAAMKAAFVEHEFVGEESEVVFLPRLLAPSEADTLLEGAVFRLTRDLAAGNVDAAMAVMDARLEEARPTSGNDRPAGDDVTSFGVVVAFVATADVDPWPLANLLDEELLEADDDETTVEATFKELSDALNAASEGLAQSLGVTEFTFLCEPMGWNSGASVARRVERLTLAKQALRTLANEHCEGEVQSLRISSKLYDCDENGNLSVSMFRASDGKLVGNLEWWPMAGEFVDESFDELEQMLREANVKVIDRELEIDVKGESVPPSSRARSVH